MDVIKHRRAAPDPWRREPVLAPPRRAADIGPGDVVFALGDWLRDADTLCARDGRTGVRLESGDDLRALVDGGLQRLALVEIVFAGFADGRGFSVARQLRARHRFTGEVRASGDVSFDRLAFMERCGFDAFVLRADQSPAEALAAFAEITVAYQPAETGVVIAAHRRGWRSPRATAIGEA